MREGILSILLDIGATVTINMCICAITGKKADVSGLWHVRIRRSEGRG